MKSTNKQRGAVSLFVVIFAALLITVVTVSFVRIMILNQQQATANDLSQSAYDSAQAGVEDAKRAILNCEAQGDSCDLGVINSPTCNVAVQTLPDVKLSDNEVPVQTRNASGGNEVSLNQAYTCVKISMNTDDYVGSLLKDESKIIPLVGVSNFDTIKIEWFNDGDLLSSSKTVDLSTLGTALLSQDSWMGTANNNQPSVMRAQLIQFNKTAGFSLNDFDGSSGNATNNTLFLYPSTTSNLINSFSGDNPRPAAGTVGAPRQEGCSGDLTKGGYACSAVIKLPATVGTDYVAYLNLKSFYRKSSYRITMYDSSKPASPEPTDPGALVQFNGVQPSVDSTGRANDLFRRVLSRVELTNIDFPYPQGEIEVSGNLCKTFFVTNLPANYSPGSCNP